VVHHCLRVAVVHAFCVKVADPVVGFVEEGCLDLT
jgi:hypothetical protein